MIIQGALHILCFGDSLTAGYSESGALYHPYAGALKTALKNAFPSAQIALDIQGLNGDQVVSPPGGFLPRMDILYEDTHPDHPYTHAVILGGTNDLGQLRRGREIYNALEAVWGNPLSHGTSVIALTIPECPGMPQVPVERLDRLNAAIMKRVDGAEGGQNFHTIDLHAKIPYVTMPEEERDEIWNDGVHFTAKGYDLMGSIIAEKIISLVVLEIEGPAEVETVDPKPQAALGQKHHLEGKLLRSG